MRHYGIFFLVLCLSAVKLLGQDFYIQGKLTDISENALPYSNIVLLEKDSTNVGYCIVDLNGDFKIKIPATGQYIINANSLGYKSYCKQIDIDEQKNIIFNISLEEKAELLQDVLIRGGTQGLYQNSDTLRYNSMVFIDGSEKVLADVLKKLPGVDVDNTGNITVQGERVEKLLLNGQDFFANNTQLAVNNLSSDIAKDIEVFSNYNELSLLNGFQNSDKTVINIKTDSTRLGKLSGTVSGGAGVENKYASKGSIIGLKPKLMTSFIAASNNTGDEVFSILDFIAIQGSINDLIGESNGIGTTELSQAESSVLISKNNTYKRTNNLVSSNFSFHPSNKLSINSYLIWNNKNETNKDINRYHYYQPYEFSNSQSVNGNTANNLFNTYIKLRYNISESSTFLSTTTYSYFNNKQFSYYSDLIFVDSIKTNGSVKNIALNFKQTLSFIKKIKFGLISTDLFLSKNITPQTLCFNTDSLLLPLNINPVKDFYRVYQEKNIEKSILGGNVSHNIMLKENHIISTTIFLQGNTQSLESTIKDSLTNSINFKIIDAGIGTSLIKNKGLFRYKLGFKYHHYLLQNNYVALKHSYIQSKVNPNIEASLHFSSKHILKLGFTVTETPINIDNFNMGIVIDNYQSYFVTSKINELLDSRYSIDLSYQINNLFSNTFYYILGNYSKYTNAGANNYRQYDLLLEQENILSQLNSDCFIMSSLSKGLGYTKWKLKVAVEYNLSEFYIESFSVGQNNSMSNYKGVVEIRSDYKKGFNIEFKTKHAYLINSNSVSIESFQYLHDYSIGLKFSNNRLYAGSSMAYRVNRTTEATKYFYDLGVNLKYTLNKSFDFEISGNNILNLKNQNWIVISDNGVYNMEKYYWQIPGNILFKIYYRF